MQKTDHKHKANVLVTVAENTDEPATLKKIIVATDERKNPDVLQAVARSQNYDLKSIIEAAKGMDFCIIQMYLMKCLKKILSH